MATQVNKVIETSCNKLIVGKTWWKCRISLGILLGARVMSFNTEQIKKTSNNRKQGL